MKLKLYSAWYCPFAQRAWMALLIKQLDFEYIEVDPYRKSDWWHRISRGHNLVPVIVAPGSDGSGEFTIVDSSRIIEYLDELEPSLHPLLPREINPRAEHRYWMDQVNDRVVPYLYQLLQAREPGAAQDEIRQKLIAGLELFTRQLDERKTFFSGDEPGAVDLALIPFAYRIDALLGHYRQFALPTDGEHWKRYQRWYRAMQEQPVFRRTATDQENYRQRLIEAYLPFSQGLDRNDVSPTKENDAA